MSYSCEISFKVLSADQIYTFFQSLKEKFEDADFCVSIGRDLSAWGPVSQLTISEISGHFDKHKDFKSFYLSKDPDDMQLIATAKDNVNKCLTFKWFYNADHRLLGVFGVPKSMQRFFDDTIYFQNGSDQDYDYETWEKVAPFKEIADKWKQVPVKTFIMASGYDESDFAEITEEYYRKSFVYEQIFEQFIQSPLWDDKKAVYISFLGFYDIQTRTLIMRAAYEAFKEHWMDLFHPERS